MASGSVLSPFELNNALDLGSFIVCPVTCRVSVPRKRVIVPEHQHLCCPFSMRIIMFHLLIPPVLVLTVLIPMACLVIFFFFLSLVLYNVLMAMCAYSFSQMISFTLLDLGGRTEIWFQFNDTEFLQEMVRQPGNFFPHGVFACSPINFISHVTVQFHFVSFHFPWKADSDP